MLATWTRAAPTLRQARTTPTAFTRFRPRLMVLTALWATGSQLRNRHLFGIGAQQRYSSRGSSSILRRLVSVSFFRGSGSGRGMSIACFKHSGCESLRSIGQHPALAGGANAGTFIPGLGLIPGLPRRNVHGMAGLRNTNTCPPGGPDLRRSSIGPPVETGKGPAG